MGHRKLRHDRECAAAGLQAPGGGAVLR